MAYGATIAADGKLYCLTCDGKMLLTNFSLKTLSEFRFIQEKRDVWGHPVICNGRLYLRYHNTLYCYDIKTAQ